MSEFTGERVIPGQVNDDLWAEHVARYAFARRFTAGKRVLDLGCGTGYGSAELADQAALAVGIDLAHEAVAYAHAHYQASVVQGSATVLPFASSSFEVVTAFEVIEHLDDWNLMLTEARRVLCPAGLLIVSTPNKLYYAEARGTSGPNPYHRHEFEFSEFRAALIEVFPHIEILLQDRLEAFAFHRQAPGFLADGFVGRSSENPASANFFVGICSLSQIPESRPFVYIPKTSNLLREREKHIGLLETELAQGNRWLKETIADREALIEKHKELEEHLDERKRWVLQVEARLRTVQERVVRLQEEFHVEQDRAQAVIAKLDEENLSKTRWAQDTIETLSQVEAALAAKTERVQELDAALAEAARRAAHHQGERTDANARLNEQIRQLTAQIEATRQSRWLKLGRIFGLGPNLGQPDLIQHGSNHQHPEDP